MFYADKTILELIAQLTMGGFFLFQGGKNLMKPAMVIGRLEAYNFPQPKLFLWTGVGLMWTGGVLVVLDFYTSVGASLLLVFTFLATVIFQRWWTVSDPAKRPYNFLMFFYNIFIMGALLLLL